MAKPIHVELKIERSAFFETMDRIGKLHGVVDVLWDPQKIFKPNGTANTAEPRGPRGPYKKKRPSTKIETKSGLSGKNFVLKLLEKGPMATAELGEAFVADGRAKSSTASTINHLKVADLIRYDEKLVGYVLSKKMKDRLRHRKEAKPQQQAKE